MLAKKFLNYLLILTFAFSYCGFASAQDADNAVKKSKKQNKELSSQAMLEELLSDTKYEHSHGIEWDARLNITKGNIILKPEKSRIMTRHEKGTEIPLAKGDTIRVSSASAAEIRLYDKVIFSLYPRTEITILSIEKTETYFDLHYGYMIGRVKPFKDKTHQIKLKTLYTNSKITGADFAAGYVPKTKTTGIAVFNSGSMSVSTINEMGLSLGLYELKNNQEMIFSAALPDLDEFGRTKDDPDYKMKDIDIKPGPLDLMEESKDRQARLRLKADRKSTRLNSSHVITSRMPSSA